MSRQPLATLSNEPAAPPLPHSRKDATPAVVGPAVPKTRPREDEHSVTVGKNRYTKLEVVGKGGSSKVFKV